MDLLSLVLVMLAIGALGVLLASFPMLLHGGGILARPRGWRVLFDELGGYVHDTAMTFWITAQSMGYTVGAWTFTIVANVGLMRHTAAANVSVIHIPITLQQNSVALKGSYLKSIDIWYKVATAAMNAVTPVVTRVIAPADNAAFPAVTTPAFTYDAGHDTAAKRLAIQNHKMTLTITSPFWLGAGDEAYVELTMDAALTTVVDVYGAFVNFTLRI